MSLWRIFCCRLTSVWSLSAGLFFRKDTVPLINLPLNADSSQALIGPSEFPKRRFYKSLFISTADSPINLGFLEIFSKYPGHFVIKSLCAILAFCDLSAIGDKLCFQLISRSFCFMQITSNWYEPTGVPVIAYQPSVADQFPDSRMMS